MEENCYSVFKLLNEINISTTNVLLQNFRFEKSKSGRTMNKNLETYSFEHLSAFLRAKLFDKDNSGKCTFGELRKAYLLNIV